MNIPINIPAAKVLVLAFENMDDFRVWAEDLTPYDVEYWRLAFEKEELYEYCAVLRDVNTHKNIVRLYNGLG